MAYASYVPPTTVTSVVTSVQNQVLSAMSTSVVSAGWSVIENGYSDGTYTRYVFRSPAADFHAVFFFSNTTYNTNGNNNYSSSTVLTAIPSTSAFLGFTVCEGYNATTHNLIRPAVCTTNIVACSTTDDSAGSGEISLASTVTNYGAIFQTPGASSSWRTGSGTWYFNILTDSLSLMFDQLVSTSPTQLSASGSLHAGKATSIVTNASTNDAYPYYATNLQTGVFPTRSAMNANKTAHIWPLSLQLFGIGTGAVENASGSDIYQGGPVFCPVIAVRNNAATDRNTYGGIRLKMSRFLNQGANVTNTIADTFTIGGTVYIYAGNSPSGYWVQRG